MSRRVTRSAKRKEEELQRKADEEYRAEKPRARTAEELAREKFEQEALKQEPVYKVPEDFSDFDEAYEEELVEEGIPDFRDPEDKMLDDLVDMDTEELEDISVEGLGEIEIDDDMSTVSLRF